MVMDNFNTDLVNIAEICARKDVRNVVLSPGSRCAPLSLSFLRHPEIKCITITDERSAAFTALGIAQQTGLPVALVCTSGTAVLNYAPAITEAFYQKIPLIIFTADRPPEWIDQFDNQSIRQNDIYEKHVLGSFEMPVSTHDSDSKWHCRRIVSEAINLAVYPVKGPVHINVPLREPLYPENPFQEFSNDKNIKIIESIPVTNIINDDLWNDLLNIWEKSKKILIFAGMGNFNPKINDSITKIQKNNNVVVISDISSNIHDVQNIHHSDMIFGTNLSELKPDLLITFGGPSVSKYARMFLRNNKPVEHWHIQESGLYGDTFQSLSKIIHVSPEYFLEKVSSHTYITKTNYSSIWEDLERKASSAMYEFISGSEFNEFRVVYEILKKLPENSLLQLGNSMPVRYANYLSMSSDFISKGICVNSNRGTSGIDGTVSTASGAAIATGKITTLITGDLAFFYDRNGLWNNFLSENLRIIILNNHGGGIFRILDGSGKLPELEKYFETVNNLNAKNTAQDFNLEYYKSDNISSLLNNLDRFFESSEKPKILEIETDSKTNADFFKEFKKLVKRFSIKSE